MDNAANPVESIFAEALRQPGPTERAAFLAKACGNNARLRARVEALLNAHGDAGSFMVAPAVHAGNPLPVTEVDKSPDSGGFDRLNRTPRQDELTEHPGSIIGRYKLLQQIGEGGFGVVYMAQQEQPVKRRVALKVIKAGMDTRAVIARFEAERQALAMMDHPNIARVLDAGATDTGRPYFVMELVKGIPITEYCDQASLGTNQRLELFVDVCRAVQHAHQKGIIHRDLKPSNIMITLHDSKPVVKVIDFGIAKATDQKLTDKTLFTNYGQMIGTPVYMSPEQAVMSGLDVDTRSDVYSLGIMLYELLAGTPPFDAKTLREAGFDEMRRIIREESPSKPSTRLSTMAHDVKLTVAGHRQSSPQALSRQLHGDLDWIVLKAIEKDRGRRYESASAFAQDIERHLKSQPVTAGAPGAIYKLRKFTERNKGPMAAVGAILLLLVVGSIVSTWQAVRATREASHAQQEEGRATREAERALTAEHQAVAALDELRATAPTFAAEAQELAAKGEFDQAIQKLDYAAKLQPDAPDFQAIKGDLYLCQLKLPEAASAYRQALRLKPGLAPVEAKANLCDQLLAAPTSTQGQLSLESLFKIYSALEPAKPSEAELKPVKEAWAGEKKRLWNYWLPRLQSLPMFAHLPPGEDMWERRFDVRNDGQLTLYLGQLDFSDLSQLKDLPVADIYLAHCRNVTDVQALADMPSLENITVPVLARNIDALRKLPKLKRLSFSATQTALSPDKAAALFSQAIVVQIPGQPPQQAGNFPLDQTPALSLLYDINGPWVTTTPATTAEEFWKEYSTLSWMSRLRDSAIKPNEISRRDDGTWELHFDNEKELTDLSFLHGMPISVLELGGTSVTDLSPLRGLPLKELYLWKTKVTDLTPIKGMSISSLDLRWTKISDLTPIMGMPIDFLALNNTTVSDLTPLRGMPLTRVLLTGCANVTDLSPLADAKHLTQLILPTNFTDYEFLRTFPNLQRLSFAENNEAPDKTADEFWAEHPVGFKESWGRKLRADDIACTASKLPDGSYQVAIHVAKFSDCSIFAGSTVRRLDLDKTSVADLKPLADLPLEALSLRVTPVTDLSPLRSPVLRDALRELRLVKTHVTDFSPIAGCTKLEIFDASETALTDLSPLKGLKLRTLLIARTPVADLSALAGMPLEQIHLARAKVTDISPLLQCQSLKAIVLPQGARDVESLRALPKLTNISFTAVTGGAPDKTAAEFWKTYNAQPK